MRKIKTILRLHYESKLSQRQIARSVQLSIGAVNKYLSRAISLGLSWPLPAEYQDEASLLKLLQPVTQITTPGLSATIDFPAIHQELRRKSVTLQLLWEEHNPKVTIISVCSIGRGKKLNPKACAKRTKRAIKFLWTMQALRLMSLIPTRVKYARL
jgi:hypothetical protein